MPFGHHPTTALRRVPAAPSIGGLRPPTSPADLTYPSIKRYTHGNSKEMKGRHPAYSKFCGSCSYYFFSVSIGITYGRRSHILCKYYVSKLGVGWGVKACADNADTGGGPKSEKSCCCNTWTLPNSNDNSIPSYWMAIQKLKKWGSFWIQKFQKYCDFWIQKSWKWTKIFLDPDIVEMVRFLDPETTEILPFLDPEFAKMDQ